MVTALRRSASSVSSVKRDMVGWAVGVDEVTEQSWEPTDAETVSSVLEGIFEMFPMQTIDVAMTLPQGLVSEPVVEQVVRSWKKSWCRSRSRLLKRAW